jgi:hypothetical protein
MTAFCPGTFPLENEQGEVFDLIKWLKKQRARAGSIRSVKAFFLGKWKKI